jgi:protein-disulfide isomerase
MFKFKFRKEHNRNLLIATAVLALIVSGTIYLFGEFLFFGSLLGVNTDSINRNVTGTFQTSPKDPLVTIAPGTAYQLTAPIINNIDPSLGAAIAKVNIVQFSRWDCSFCQQQESILRQALSKHGQDVKLIHKDYPAKDITAISYQAAVAARCAAEQGKFWEYGAELYKHSKKISPADLTLAANSLQLDSSEFQDCLRSGKVRQLVNNNIDEGDNLEITGVPFIYVNQQKVTGEITVEELDRMIDAELKK